MEEQKIETQKCQRCKVNYSIDNYNSKRNGVLLKNCKRCLEKVNESRIKNKCEHKRQRNNCIDCGGSSICEHQRQRGDCKICNEPIQITIKNMIKSAKQSDKKYNRYDQTKFIDYCFVENMIDDSENKCHYCKCELQYQEYAKI